MGQNWDYFCSTGSGFRDTGRFSKLPYLGMKLGHWPKFQKLHIHVYPVSTPGGEIEFIFALRAAVCEIWADFQNCRTWAWNLAITQNSKSCIYHLSSSWGRNWAYFRSTGSGFQDTGRFSKLPYLGMKLKCHKLYIYILNYPRVPNFTQFCSTAGHFQDIGNFAFSH